MLFMQSAMKSWLSTLLDQENGEPAVDLQAMRQPYGQVGLSSRGRFEYLSDSLRSAQAKYRPKLISRCQEAELMPFNKRSHGHLCLKPVVAVLNRRFRYSKDLLGAIWKRHQKTKFRTPREAILHRGYQG